MPILETLGAESFGPQPGRPPIAPPVASDDAVRRLGVLPMPPLEWNDQVAKQCRIPSRSGRRSVCASIWTTPSPGRAPASAFTTGHAVE